MDLLLEFYIILSILVRIIFRGGAFATYYYKNGKIHTLKGNFPILLPFSVNNPMIENGSILFRFAPASAENMTFYFPAYKNGVLLINSASISDNNKISAILYYPPQREPYSTRSISLLISAGAVYWYDGQFGPMPSGGTSADPYNMACASRIIIDTTWVE